ncbi:type ISP restriction/modification enzyme [Dongia sp.]|uniref:type ISP restriction/modification enzyme n=1 Tax=Dongia sp. TaxID=1977262 RepID=UPI0035B32746
MKSIFERYLTALRKTALDSKTEHTDRSALEALLGEFASLSGPGVAVQHEPKRIAAKGAPDFKVSKKGSILGYVENKAIGENLDQVIKSEQIKKYRSLSSNILLTDYLQFVWLDDKGVRGRETLCFASDVENHRYKLRDDKVEAVGAILKGFFSSPPQGIGRAHDLALALATRSQLLRDFMDQELHRQEKVHREGRLYGLYQVFKAQVFHELELSEFADAFAQMLAYGLFLARLNSGKEPVTLTNARQFVPGSFALIRELVQFVEDLQGSDYAEIRWVVDEVLSIVNGLDLAAIHKDLSFRNRKATTRKVRARDEEEHRLFERDPFIYFYEDFLGKYDAKMKKARGVYYTPPPIVNFIVRAVDDILKETFGIKTGLADHKRVTVLDFACGTGTFLVEVLERIFENTGGADSAKASTLVREHILKNIYGFEYLLAPYTIAHLKLSQYLADKDHPLTGDERLQVFLTNTLEPIEPQRNLLLPELSAETAEAQAVKDKPILVITGNPPYSGHSKNKGEWITASIEAYREGFPELSKPGQGKWLQDDYVKFIRFAQMKMDVVEEGVVGIITNHSWLDNPTFRGMRKSLLDTFDQIYVLDLHGSAKKKQSPDGDEDQNVFDIEQGVSISLFIKKKDLGKAVLHSDVWGSRLEKYVSCAESSIAKVRWTDLSPSSPSYLFIPRNIELASEYEKNWAVSEIFSRNGDPAPSLVTTHDQFAISFSRDEAVEKVRLLLATASESEARQIFRLCSQSQWNYLNAKQALAKLDVEALAKPITYRPFDGRWTIWDSNVAVHRRERVMRHMMFDNVGLLTCRQLASNEWLHVFVALQPTDDCVVSNRTKERGYLFPLYLHRSPEGVRRPRADLFGDADPFGDFDRVENVSPAFREWLNNRYEHNYAPEELFGYIYGVLHAPSYRARFAEFLRGDFPRIPFPQKRTHFDTLSKLGWDLVQKHLLRDVPALKLGVYRGKGDNQVEKPRYVAAEQAVYINDRQHFAPVPAEVWDFHIGGYQVIDKYLKYRKGRMLSLDEINNVENMVNVLAFTIAQMERIDAAYLAAFGDPAG